MYWREKRNQTDGKPKTDIPRLPKDWAVRDKTKTVSSALVVCLNLGVDPPDVVKPNPSATRECWINPADLNMANPKILEAIGKKLQEQFESLSIKTRYKQYLDPSVDETRKFCTALRRNAKEERVLFYYNGHGVPRPTPSGEIWVFNRDYTQYIPISLYELQTWLGGPSLLIYDCSHAGNVIANYEKYVQKHEDDNAEARRRDPEAVLQNYGNNLHLAACGKTEQLPTNPGLPADLFTSCLTTPIHMALLFHVMQSPLNHDLALEDIEKIPGKSSERRSPMGELNWILTAITDTIAWNALPTDLFRKLFRQDLMVAALFRNYLVAERIMTAYGCHPQTVPALPPTHNHPLWDAWDLAAEMVVSQVPDVLADIEAGRTYQYDPSIFFTEQLGAFEHYLKQGASQRELPIQLPIVLQVLLSQVHRITALQLLSKFLDLGSWAVNLALTIGIHPYVVKLLQSPALELKPIMIFIWARMIAVAPQDFQNDLIRDNNFSYFTNVLSPNCKLPLEAYMVADLKSMCAFVVAMFCHDFNQAQHVCLRANLMEYCLHHLNDEENHLLRQWSCVCIGLMWKNFPEAKWAAIRCSAHHKLLSLIIDPIPDVRAAIVYALTQFVGTLDITEQVAQNEKLITSALMVMTTDGNAMVRKEILVFYSAFVKRYRNKFLVAAYETLVEELEALLEKSFGGDSALRGRVNGMDTASSKSLSDKVSEDTVQGAIWYQLVTLSVDGHPEVAQLATLIIDFVHNALLESPLAAKTFQILDQILDLSQAQAKPPPPASRVTSRAPSVAPSARQGNSPAPVPNPTPHQTPHHAPQKSEGYLSMGFRRTASVAAALKYLVGGNGSTEDLTNGDHRPLPASARARPDLPAEWSNPPDLPTPEEPPKKLPKAKVPRPKQFQERIGREIVDMPLPSTFIEYSMEYFLEPQMKPGEPDEPGSDRYNEKLWRRNRNNRILQQTQPLKGYAGSSRWTRDVSMINNGSQPYKLTFHEFDSVLAIADDRDTISIFDWPSRTRLSRFSNGNPKYTKINEARFINEDDAALLMTGSSDGVVKLFRNYEHEEDVELVTSFRALTEMVPSTRNAGLVFDWQQNSGKLLCAGDAKVIRVWNAATELCETDIPARSGSCITSITSDRVTGFVFAAGYGDGAVRVFDRRVKPAMAMVRLWKEHRQWITRVHMQRGGQRELISGSRNGEVRLWDLRMQGSVGEVRVGGGTLRTLGVHEHAPVFAA